MTGAFRLKPSCLPNSHDDSQRCLAHSDDSLELWSIDGVESVMSSSVMHTNCTFLTYNDTERVQVVFAGFDSSTPTYVQKGSPRMTSRT